MTDNDKRQTLDRRQLMTATAGLAGAAFAAPGLADAAGFEGAGNSRNLISAFPHDSFRDYIRDLERRGLLMRVKRLDQDAYEMTALSYRLMDCVGMYEAPTVLVEEVKIDGEWVKGPVIFNNQGHWDTEAIVLGFEPVPNHGKETYREAISRILTMLADNDGKLPLIPPVEISRDQAPVKEQVYTGDDIDILKFPFIKSNPADSARYVNTGSVFTEDVELGKNFGTYRCEIKGPRTLGVNPEPGQGAWKMLMKKKERGDTEAQVSIVLGQDPIVWLISGSSVSKDGTDELSIAGGMRGKPVEVVKSETNDMMVPAHAEMVIEGIVPLDEPMQPEGPFGEMYGYLGLKKSENFFMNITAVTCRKDPWILNQFTGVTRGFITSPLEGIALARLRKFQPDLVMMHTPVESTGLSFVSIKKTKAGQGLVVGNAIAKFVPIAKVVVVVDDDIDVLDRAQVMHAIGSRWQPYPASEIIESARGMPLDPSSPNRPNSSKIVIDATRQWPEEGGPEIYPELNRTLLEKLAPESFTRVDEFWGELLREWQSKRA
ncbi:MAG: UbiD family decarboxylase [Gammaproteobacteria bacterium]|nr:UbiD family decarboxylase [Gammaproteobacteria bacterium]